MHQDVGGRAAKFGLGGRTPEVVLTEAIKKDLDVGDVVGGLGVADDDVVEVRSGALQAFDDQVKDLSEPTGGGTAALRHHKPLEEPSGVQNAVKGMVSLSMVIWLNEETKSKREKIALFLKTRGPRRRRECELSEGADGVQLFIVDGDADTAVRFHDSDRGA